MPLPVLEVGTAESLERQAEHSNINAITEELILIMGEENPLLLEFIKLIVAQGVYTPNSLMYLGVMVFGLLRKQGKINEARAN